MSTRPNILILSTDQQRYDTLGFTGNPLIRTPNIDSLADTGKSFSHAFSPCPLCCPARQTFLTGVMPAIHGGHWNYGITSRIKGLKPDEFPTWTQLLKDAGYNTGYVGKWHVDPVADPTDFGYDRYVKQMPTPKSQQAVKFDVANEISESEPMGGMPPGMYDTAPVDETATHKMADETVRMIEDFARRGEPWHVRLDYSQPHLPCVPAEPFASMYAPQDIPQWGNFPDELSGKPYIQRRQLESWNLTHWGRRQWSEYLSGYYGIISQYDDAYGRILETLDRLGLFENTMIVYTTDHGDAAGSHGMMDKHYVMYEEEVRVPLVVRWDGVVSPASTTEAFVSNYLDLGPTILDAVGLEIPEGFQGVSVMPELRGATGQASERDLIFSEYNGQQFGLYTQRMVRDRRFKYVWNPTDVDELYDLENDPWEMVNLAESRTDVIARYRRRLHETFAALGDKMADGLWTRYQLTGETHR